MTAPTLYPRLESLVSELEQQPADFPPERKILLNRLVEYLENVIEAEKHPLYFNFICTHNSRRSHMARIWAELAARRYGLDIAMCSGGTEATAFNPSAIEALRRAGFRVACEDVNDANPHYHVSYAEDVPSLECYSKTYDDPSNPQHGFTAIMTCSQADFGCPVVPGAGARFALTYDDPKASDGTPEESATYDACNRQIGRELLYVFGAATGRVQPV